MIPLRMQRLYEASSMISSKDNGIGLSCYIHKYTVTALIERVQEVRAIGDDR